MKTETVALDSLTPDPANARKHSARNIEAIKASLTRFGQQKPIVVDGKNVVRAGNGTLEAAKALEWESIEIVRSDLEPTEMTAFAIADNRTAELAEWDYEVLGQVLGALEEQEEGSAALLGFGERELAAMLTAIDPLIDQPDVAPLDDGEVNADPGVDEYSLRINGLTQGTKDQVEEAVRAALATLEMDLEVIVF
jgi:ParB-like chromosome segregation protein Spo0J